MRKLEQMEWWPELLSIKDQFTLRELAERFEVSAAQIDTALKRNGIDREPWPRSRSPRRERKVGLDKPQSVAQQLAPFADMIGRVPDDEVRLDPQASRCLSAAQGSVMTTNLLGRRVSFATYNPDATETGEIVAVHYRRDKPTESPTLEVWVAGEDGRIEKRSLMHLTLIPSPTSEVPNGR